MSKVVAVKVPSKAFDDEILSSIRSAVDSLGGPDEIAQPGDSVLVKPNFCSTSVGSAVDRRFPWAVARLFKEIGCKATIGENPVVNVSSRELFSSPHIVELQKRTGVEVVNLRAEEMVNVDIPNSRSCGTISFSKRVLDADVVVGVPAMRKHAMTGVTLAIKNMYGTIAPSSRLRVHRSNLSWGLVEINKVVGQKLIVMDGTSIVTDGSMIPFGYVFASTDPVAIDSVAATCMGFDPEKIEHIRYAKEAGLGQTDLDKIELIGITREDIQKFKKENGPRVVDWPNPAELVKEIPGVEIVMGDACGTCVRTLATALVALRQEKIPKEPEVAVLIGPDAKPVKGKVNVIAGRCLKDLSDQGIFVDFCPAYANDIKNAVKLAKGLNTRFEYMWDEILRTREKDLPGA
ncbi:MAG TPA: DUF362 domain-containing protein [Thermoproteota archaeon]|nr:DUF362 domain-containing protein [Thermoproteota archaeon]